jgi:hypothetical protein
MTWLGLGRLCGNASLMVGEAFGLWLGIDF